MHRGINRIVLAGNGHGAIIAFISLSQYFSKIDLISDDKALISMLRTDDRLISAFLDSDADFCVCAGYQKMIEKCVLDAKTIINTHPSLLPKYRGMHSLVWAMLNGEEEVGFSVHLMNECMDDGDILEQYTVQNIGQSSKEIMDEFDSYVHDSLGRVVSEYIAGSIVPTVQDRSKATWVPKRNINDCILDFNMPNWQIRALFKALVNPYPLPRIVVGSCCYEITSYELVDVEYYTDIGRVVNIEGSTAFVKVKEGLLLIKSLFDPKSEKEISPASLLKIGQRL